MVITKDEMHQIIGRDAVEYVDLGRTCAALDATLYFIARDLSEIARDLDRHMEPAAEKLDNLPTAARIRELLARRAELLQKRDARRESLRQQGVLA